MFTLQYVHGTWHLEHLMRYLNNSLPRINIVEVETHRLEWMYKNIKEHLITFSFTNFDLINFHDNLNYMSLVDLVY